MNVVAREALVFYTAIARNGACKPHKEIPLSVLTVGICRSSKLLLLPLLYYIIYYIAILTVLHIIYVYIYDTS